MDDGNCFTHTETPCWAISGSEARSVQSLIRAVSQAQGGKASGLLHVGSRVASALCASCYSRGVAGGEGGCGSF